MSLSGGAEGWLCVGWAEPHLLAAEDMQVGPWRGAPVCLSAAVWKGGKGNTWGQETAGVSDTSWGPLGHYGKAHCWATQAGREGGVRGGDASGGGVMGAPGAFMPSDTLRIHDMTHKPDLPSQPKRSAVLLLTAIPHERAWLDVPACRRPPR